MRIIAFITEPPMIKKILRHLAAFGVSFTLHLVASGRRPPAPYPPEALNTSPHRGTIGPGEKGNS